MSKNIYTSKYYKVSDFHLQLREWVNSLSEDEYNDVPDDCVTCHNNEGQFNSMYGKKHSEETKKLIGEKSKNRSPETLEKLRIAATGANNGNYGKPAWNRNIPLSESTKEKISEWSKNYWTEENRKKRSDKVKGSNNPMYGRKQSEETKRKISETKKMKNLERRNNG